MALTPTPYEIRLDGMTYQDPVNWRETSLTHKWQTFGNSARVFLAEGGASFAFVGDAADYLTTQFEASLCGTVDVVVTVGMGDRAVVILTGKIYLSEIEIDRRRCIVQAQLSEDGFSSWIKEKIRQPFDLSGVYDYGTGTVAAVVPTGVQFHIVTTGVHGGANRDGYSVFDAFTYMVDALSEDQMGFASTIFDTGGAQEGAFLFYGEELRTATSAQGPQVSFLDLLDDLDSLFNLGCWVEESGGVLTLHIEEFETYFFDTAVGLELSVDEVTEKVDVERLHSVLKVGSDNTTEQGANAQFPIEDSSHRGVGWIEEEYGILADCVVDNTLDLRLSRLVIDSNTLENVGAGATGSDRDTFLVDVNTATSQTVATAFTGTGDFYYNFEYTNGNAMARRPFDLPGAIWAYRGDLDDLFDAELSADVSGTTSLNQNPVQYDTENNDPNGNYDNAVNFEYNCPVAGAYVFQTSTVVDLTGGDARLEIRWMIDRGAGYAVEAADAYDDPDPSDTLIRGPALEAGQTTVATSRVFVLAVGDLVRVQVDISQITGGPNFTAVDLKAGSTFAAVSSATGGGQTRPYDPDDMRVNLYESEAIITAEDYATWLADRTKKVQLNMGGQQFVGHVKELEWEPFGRSPILLWARRNP